MNKWYDAPPQGGDEDARSGRGSSSIMVRIFEVDHGRQKHLYKRCHPTMIEGAPSFVLSLVHPEGLSFQRRSLRSHMLLTASAPATLMALASEPNVLLDIFSPQQTDKSHLGRTQS